MLPSLKPQAEVQRVLVCLILKVMAIMGWAHKDKGVPRKEFLGFQQKLGNCGEEANAESSTTEVSDDTDYHQEKQICFNKIDSIRKEGVEISHMTNQPTEYVNKLYKRFNSQITIPSLMFLAIMKSL